MESTEQRGPTSMGGIRGKRAAGSPARRYSDLRRAVDARGRWALTAEICINGAKKSEIFIEI